MTKVSILEPRRFDTATASVSIECEPIVHELDAGLLGLGPAQALAVAVSDGIRRIDARAAPATLRFRATAKRSFSRGAAWAQDRYRGLPPNRSDRLFNDSGEMASLTVQRSGDMYAIAAPSNRGTATGNGASTMPARLRAVVQVLRDPFSDVGLRAAIDATSRVLFP